MKNTLGDLNNYLFEQLERLNDDTITGDQLDREIRKTDSMIKVADKIIQNGELAFKTMQHMDEYGYNMKKKNVPVMLQIEGDEANGRI